MDALDIYQKLFEQFGSQHWWPKHKGKKRPGFDPRFEIIVGAILTQNTAWKNVEKAIECLYEKDLLDAAAIARAPIRQLESCIRSSGYYRQKVKKLKIAARFLLRRKFPFRARSGSKWENFFAPTREELLSLWGIGRETADSILLYAFNKPIFVVDAYTRRFLAAHGQKKLSLADYDKIRRFFEDRLPRDAKLFKEYHALIVRWGKGGGRKNVKM